MIDDQVQIRVIYEQQKIVSYSNIFELFDLNFKKFADLFPYFLQLHMTILQLSLIHI